MWNDLLGLEHLLTKGKCYGFGPVGSAEPLEDCMQMLLLSHSGIFYQSSKRVDRYTLVCIEDYAFELLSESDNFL